MHASGLKAVAFFMDGTSNAKPEPTDGPADPGRVHSNVALLSDWIPDSLRPGPVERYISGVATTPVRDQWRAVIRASNALGVVFGFGLTGRIQKIYRRLCEHYRDGDAIFLFGFSRGACAARVLAGFVDEVGLLLESELERVDEAWSIYIRSGDADASDLRAYLRKVQNGKYARPSADNGNQLRLYFLGVWDTVAMWHTVNGVLFDPTERLIRVPSNVSHARQAFAIHEVRRYFPELPWTELHPSVPPPDSIDQVWFPGNHADVGGGYVAGEDALSRHALAWMIGEAAAVGLPVHVPVPQAPLDARTPLLVHDQSHRYEPGLTGRFSRLMTPVLNIVRRPTIAIRTGLSMPHHADGTMPIGLSLDEGYVTWLLDGGSTAFEADLPDETRTLMVLAEDAAVQMALRQPYERDKVEPPAWIVQTTAATVRGCAREIERVLASPQNAEIDVDALATSLKFQVLLRGAGFWAEIDRTIREAVDSALIADAPFDLLDLWSKRLDGFDKAAARAAADLPPSLKGEPVRKSLEEQVVIPVRLAGIRAGMRGTQRSFTADPPLRLVRPQSV